MSFKRDRLEELLKYYKEFHEEIWLLERKYEDMKELTMAKLKIQGKIELLEELIKEVDDK